MKRIFVSVVGLLALFTVVCVAAEPRQAGRVADYSVGSVGFNPFASMNIVVYALNDPRISGVTCHVQIVENRGMTLASNPSNSSIACRQTGPIDRAQLATIGRGPNGEVVFADGQGGLDWRRGILAALSGLFKEVTVRRFYDEANDTLIYISNANRAVEGSPRASISTVPLHGVPR